MTERRALVTGGTRGIGNAVARALVRAGYQVTATGVSEEEVAASKPDDGIEFARMDVTDADQIAALIGRFERLDALVNCAGTIVRDKGEFDTEVFSRVIDVNLTGTMRMCVAAKPLLARQGGSIVNTASMLSFFGGPLVPAYAASKGGVAQLTKSLAGAWADDGIRVNAIAPGWISTDMIRPLQQDEARSAVILGRTPMGRWGAPEELGGAVAFLCSPDAGFITGVVLPVDGGYLTV